MRVETIVKILSDALSDPKRLPPTIVELQRVMWQDEAEGPEEALEVLRDLAVDLDYYEQNPEWRARDRSFIDEERALSEIRAALSKLKVS